jgi:glycosyltransferase involved in cell wall biosynthesis
MGLSIVMLLHKSVVHDSRVRREAGALAEAGHAVTVVELDPDASGTIDGFRRVSASPPAWIERALPFHLYRAAFLVWFLARILRLRPDAVHAHDAAMLLPGLIGARLTRARLVYDSHELATGVPYRDGRWAAFVSWIERIAVPRTDAVITVSDGIADRLQELYELRDRPVVVRNACALPARPPDGTLRRTLGIGDAPLVLHQGAAAPGRGCESLVRALPHVRGANLVFLGDGEPGFTEQLDELAAGLGLEQQVHFHPAVPMEELLSYTAEADVGVTLLEDTCENHRLALPNKLFEYLAAGVPVVASDLAELRVFVKQHGVGWLVDASEPASIARGLSAGLDPDRARAVRARVAMERGDLTWAAERAGLLNAYDRLAARSVPTRRPFPVATKPVARAGRGDEG